VLQLPLIDAGDGGALALYKAAPDAAAALLLTALAAHPLLPAAAHLGDRLSRHWLTRRNNPYRDEISAIAHGIGRAGVYFLNLVYEYACSTSAAPDPARIGNRMIRVLDWGMPGIGRYVVIGRHDAPAGEWYNVTWPGFVGVLTAMAPGRFSAAINQGPRQRVLGPRLVDEAIIRLRMLLTSRTVPAAHLLRRVFEAAPDFESAVAMLADESVALAMPAIFTLSGVGPGEAAVVEALGRRRVVHRGAKVAATNAWLCPDLPGVARLHPAVAGPGETAAANNLERRRCIAALQDGVFVGAAALRPPVLNGHTVLVAEANAAAGTLRVEALDQVAGAELPAVVGNLTLAAPANEPRSAAG
jgi:hypothetical protein